MIKTAALRRTIAKADGYYTPRGEKVKGARLSAEQIAAWNGEAPKAEPKVVEVEIKEEVAPIAEEAEVEVAEEGTIAKLAKKFGKK